MLSFVPIKAMDCHIEGTIDTIVETLNLYGQMYSDLDNKIFHAIDIESCTYEKINNTTGAYSCHVNASTEMIIFTDQFRNAKVLQIYGLADNGKPKRTTFDWALYATTLACQSLYMQDIIDIFTNAYSNFYYENEDITIACGLDPDFTDIWHYVIKNK